MYFLIENYSPVSLEIFTAADLVSITAWSALLIISTALSDMLIAPISFS
jgi:hypothetical protein